MSGKSTEAANSVASEQGKSPRTPQAKKLVQGRLPFAIVDNKSPNAKPLADSPKIKLTSRDNEPVKESLDSKKSKGQPVLVSVTSKGSEMIDLASDCSLLSADSEKTEKKVAEEEEEDDEEGEEEAPGEDHVEENVADASFSSKDSHEVSGLEGSAKKRMTPKQKDRLKKKEEMEQKRTEKERQKRQKQEEKEAEKRKKEEEKRKKEEEKEAEKRKKEEEKRKKEEDKEAEKRKKEEDKRKKEEEKEAEKRKKEEEKRKKEEEKEAEKRREEEKEKRKMMRTSQAFTSFFTSKRSSITKSDDQPSSGAVTLAFPPFQIKENMRLAPGCRTSFDDKRKEELDRTLRDSSVAGKADLFLDRLGRQRGRKCGPTWPISKEVDLEVIEDEDDAAAANAEDVVVGAADASGRRLRAKLLAFCENRRPAYWGTWRKKSRHIGPRRPVGRDEDVFDYEVDSDDEWEEEAEPGESLTDSEPEGDDKEPADDYEVDNEFLVPHGYLSDEEGDKDEDEKPLSPSRAKERLKMQEEQFERELKEKTCHIKPSLLGCCWNTSPAEPQLLKVLQRYAAVVLAATTPINVVGASEAALVCDATGADSPVLTGVDGAEASRSEKGVPKRVVSDQDLPVLIRLVHGNLYSRPCIVKEFQLHLQRQRTDERNAIPSKLQVVNKINEIASWTKCAEAGPMNGRTCWLVHAAVLERHQLGHLSAVNTWEFSTETKKRGRKSDAGDRSVDGDETPPPKTARVSLMKKFVQPVPPISQAATSDSPAASESDGPPSTPASAPEAAPAATAAAAATTTAATTTAAAANSNATTPAQPKKRVALISLSTSASKKPRNDSMATPLTNFLRKMAAPKNDEKVKQPPPEADCTILD